MAGGWIGRRDMMAGIGAAGLLGGRARAAAQPFRFLTNWYAQAEHAGFYQAAAKGFYAAEGLDVTMEAGGPQVNGSQLLLAGHYDMIIGGADEAMTARSRGMPMTAVATTFQKSLGGLLAHADIGRLEDLRGHTILLSTEVRAAVWPYLRRRFGFDDGQVRPYAYDIRPFVLDPGVAIQAFATSEPYAVQQKGIPYKFFMLADYTVENYGNALVTTEAVLGTRRDAIARFLRASMRGWADWLAHDPSPANDAIRKANPMMSEAQILWSRGIFLSLGVFGAAGTPIGPMAPARCRAVRDFLVAAGLLPPDADWARACDFSFNPAMDARLPAI